MLKDSVDADQFKLVRFDVWQSLTITGFSGIVFLLTCAIVKITIIH
jgi:hypothetical protein